MNKRLIELIREEFKKRISSKTRFVAIGWKARRNE